MPATRLCCHPEVLWAQRSDKVYLTASVKCEPHGLFTFTASTALPWNFMDQLNLSLLVKMMKAVMLKECYVSESLASLL
ncbi:hypothetical protein KIW84_012326 [Lathyrus oleraceus]|uniref:Uncharacterized protein n=1 Tax=Pisum sativum TaxID=3888 RepID=A0A9D5BHA2_PEA|nr:hypothetical protein KIW84_012326 [Pisum sativum]